MKRRLLAVTCTRQARGLIQRTAEQLLLLVRNLDGTAEAIAELEVMPSPDLIVVESGPSCDGLRLLRYLRRRGEDALVMVVAHGGEKVALRAFRDGADDVVSTKSSREEVAARLSVMLRRLRMDVGSQRLLPKLTFDRESLHVLLDRRQIPLTATEYQILHLLARKSGRTLSRAYLISQIWNTSTEVSTRSVDMHVSHLRRKLGGASLRIATVRPSGYRLEPVKRP